MLSLQEEDDAEGVKEISDTRATMPGLMANIGVSQLTGENINRTFPTIQAKTNEFLATQGQTKFKAAVMKASIIEK